MPIHHFIALAAKWLLTQAGSSIFSAMKQRLAENMGFSSRAMTTADAHTLLDDYLQRFEKLQSSLIERMDQERIIKLQSGIMQMKWASKTQLKREYLSNAADKFFDIANLPDQHHEQTAGIPNTQLRCLAFIGLAAVHMEMNETPGEIAENIARAIELDRPTAELWFGKELVQQLVTQVDNDENAAPIENGGSAQRHLLANVKMGTILYTYNGHVGSSVRCLAWSPTGSRIASGGTDATVQVWDATTGRNVFTYGEHSGKGVEGVSWSPDGRSIASASETIHIWNTDSGKFLYPCQGHTGDVADVKWSKDGMYIASAGRADRTARVWDASNGKPLLLYRKHKGPVSSVTWSPDSAFVASASDDMTVQVWDAISGNSELTYRGHTDTVQAVSWSPNGIYIASGGADKTVHVWEAGTSRHICTYQGHMGNIYALSWSPDSQFIASSSSDRRVHIWEAITGKTRYTHHGHTGEPYVLAWSPVGTYIASGEAKGIVQVWQALEPDLHNPAG